MLYGSSDEEKKRDAFFGWLTLHSSPTQVSQTYDNMANLEKYCADKRLIKESIFNISDKTIVNRLRTKLEGDKLFRFFNRGKTMKMLSALKSYTQYLERPVEVVAVEPEKMSIEETPAAEPVAPSNEEQADQQSVSVSTQLQENIAPDENAADRFWSFLRQKGKTEHETNTMLAALSGIDDVIKSSNDIDDYMRDAKTSLQASRIFSSLLLDPMFNKLDIKKKNLYISASQAFISMLRESEAKNDQKTDAVKPTAKPVEVEEPREIVKPRVVEVTPSPVQIETIEETEIEKDDCVDPIIEYLRKKNIWYIDNRNKGGALWMLGDMSLSWAANDLKKMNAFFSFAPKGSKSTKGACAWYMLNSQRQPKFEPQKDINAKDVIAWLVTQPNANGTLYLERVVRVYMCALRTTPQKLILHDGVNQNVFSCHTVDELDKLWSLYKEAPNYKEIILGTSHGSFSAALAVYRRYLEHIENGDTIPSDVQPKKLKLVNYIRGEALRPDVISRVDFDHPELCGMTKPVSCTILGRDVTVKKNNWAQLLYAITEYFIRNGNSSAKPLDRVSLYGGMAFFRDKKPDNGTSIMLSNGKWLYVKYAPKAIVTIIGRLCRHYNIDLNDVVITYKANNDGFVTPVIVPPPIALPDDADYLILLKEYFPDGYVPGDFICQTRMRTAYKERFGGDCQSEGSELDDRIRRIGTVKDGRVYATDDTEKELLREICIKTTDILRTYTCVYGSELFERYRERLTAVSIYSPDALMSAMSELANGAFIKSYGYLIKEDRGPDCAEDCRTFMRANPGATTIAKLREVLWFIPEPAIKSVLMSASDCIWVSAGTYMLIEHFPITREDADRIGSFIDGHLRNHDYLLISRLRDMLADNTWGVASDMGQYAPSTISDVLRYYLNERFSFTKVIVSNLGRQIDIPTLFADYGKEHPRFSLDELEAFAAELCVGIYWEALYTHAVRISADEYVNDGEIRFNVPAIDAVLEQICVGVYLPIADISEAIMIHLPDCGCSWNGYLLHSYVYKFSKLFKLVYRSMTKGKFTGAMVRRSSKIDSYMQLVERVLTDDQTWRTKNDAFALLIQHGYQTQMRLDGIEEIIKRIQK